MITVYSKPNCQPCRLTKVQLDSMGVEYVEKNVDDSEQARSEALEYGHRQMPIVVTGDDHWSGFRPDKLAELGKPEGD
ncbi:MULTISPECIES: glutaredoxin family protein [unclassified Halomonas]|uniref:glutaredoxin family protein n=1 Tax=unclassified Halomonas TaxID=2609666 RepID=UPI0020767F85|nr:MULTISPECIES: glutaredoxin family protein [unclassified Halomonas]